MPTSIAYIPLTALNLGQLTDNMHIVVNTTDQFGNPLVLADFIGDFFGATLDDVINAIVVEINLSGTGYTASNANPRIKIEVETSNNLSGIIITVDFEACFYLRGTGINTRQTAMTTLGYGAQNPVRPAYIPFSGSNPTFAAGGRVYVPNGDNLDYIYPSTVAGVPRVPPCNFPPAGASLTTFTQDITGAVVGSLFSEVIAPGLTTNFFTAGSEFEMIRVVVDVNKRTLGGVLTTPLSDFSNTYIVRCRITAYNSGTGLLDYEILSMTNITTTGAITPFPALTAAYNPAAPAYGTQGNTAIGAVEWFWQSRGHGWSTVSIFNVINPTPTTSVLTFVQNMEIPVRISASGDSVYVVADNSIFIAGYGAGTDEATVVKIDLTANPLIYDSYVSLAITGNYSILTLNPVTGNLYASNNNILSKIDTSLQYNILVNQTVPSGSMTYDSLGIIYVAPPVDLQMAVRKGDGVPAIAYGSADPVFNILFTAPDFQTAVSLAVLSYDYGGYVNGQASSSIISAGLNSSTTIIWIPGATFKLVTIGATTYTLNCTIITYNNGNGALTFTINTITQTTAGVTTPATPLPAIGTVNWTYTDTPFIKGAINIYLHTTGRLFATRSTNVGAILHSYDVTLTTEAEIIASRIIHTSPTGVVLSGYMNYQNSVPPNVADRIFLPSTSGNQTYIFDPNTLLWSCELLPVQQPAGGGMQRFSYTGDGTESNMFSDASGGVAVSVVSIHETNDQFSGLFYNLSVNDSNCPFCYEYPLIACYDNYVFDLDLTPNTIYNIILTDKFQKKYRQQITSDADGKIMIDPDPFPEGFFTPENGNLTMEITDENNIPVDIIFGYTIYTCITLTFEYNNLME